MHVKSVASSNHLRWGKPALKLLLFIAPLSLFHFLSLGNCVLALQTSPISHARVQHRINHARSIASPVAGGFDPVGKCTTLSWRTKKQTTHLYSSRSTTTSTSYDVWEKVGNQQKPTDDGQQKKQSSSSAVSAPVQSHHNIPTSKTIKALQYIQSITVASFFGAREAIRQSWWLFPMTLALVPVYCSFLGTQTTTPSWYYVVPLNHLTNSPYAVAVVGGFLMSNIFYFLSGLFMLDLIPLGRVAFGRKVRRLSRHLARDPLLGASVITAGLVSTIYHSVQTLGSYTMAQELCFIDTGVALSSTAYFVQRLGLPSWKTLMIGGAGILSWMNPLDGSYAGFHSLWHFFSASATISWGFDGFKRKALLKPKFKEA